MKIELTEQQLHNLKVFLERLDLKGREVPTYVNILNALNPPIENKNINKK